MKRSMFIITLGAAAVAVAWYLFRPERLLLDSVVTESLDEAAAPGAVAASVTTVVLAQGSFRGVHHEGNGNATVYLLDDGSRVLRLTEFATDNGPDLYVYLVAAPDAPDNETVERAGHISLGRLKGNKGAQNYVLPPGVDLSRYRTVSIWCRRFGVNFAVAALRPAAAGTSAVHDSEAHGASEPAGPPAGIITVRPPAEVPTRQGLANFVGISEATAGSKGISMNLVIIPPGGAAVPHIHDGFESAIYVLQGRVETRYGTGLEQSVTNEEGDFLYIPSGVPHQPRNLSPTERALAIVARNTANEQESVIPYEPDEG